LTIKCGKTQENNVNSVNIVNNVNGVNIVNNVNGVNNVNSVNNVNNVNSVNSIKNKEYNKSRKYHKKTWTVKIGELPVDMTEEEMMELLYNWGHIIKIRVLNYNENSTAYVEFGYEDEADYFVEAIDKTPFYNYNILLQVSKL
jgi:hypothetical protein